MKTISEILNNHSDERNSLLNEHRENKVGYCEAIEEKLEMVQRHYKELFDVSEHTAATADRLTAQLAVIRDDIGNTPASDIEEVEDERDLMKKCFTETLIEIESIRDTYSICNSLSPLAVLKDLQNQFDQCDDIKEEMQQAIEKGRKATDIAKEKSTVEVLETLIKDREFFRNRMEEETRRANDVVKEYNSSDKERETESEKEREQIILMIDGFYDCDEKPEYIEQVERDTMPLLTQLAELIEDDRDLLKIQTEAAETGTDILEILRIEIENALRDNGIHHGDKKTVATEWMIKRLSAHALEAPTNTQEIETALRIIKQHEESIRETARGLGLVSYRTNSISNIKRLIYNKIAKLEATKTTPAPEEIAADKQAAIVEAVREHNAIIAKQDEHFRNIACQMEIAEYRTAEYGRLERLIMDKVTANQTARSEYIERINELEKKLYSTKIDLKLSKEQEVMQEAHYRHIACHMEIAEHNTADFLQLERLICDRFTADQTARSEAELYRERFEKMKEKRNALKLRNNDLIRSIYKFNNCGPEISELINGIIGSTTTEAAIMADLSFYIEKAACCLQMIPAPEPIPTEHEQDPDVLASLHEISQRAEKIAKTHKLNYNRPTIDILVEIELLIEELEDDYEQARKDIVKTAAERNGFKQALQGAGRDLDEIRKELSQGTADFNYIKKLCKDFLTEAKIDAKIIDQHTTPELVKSLCMSLRAARKISIDNNRKHTDGALEALAKCKEFKDLFRSTLSKLLFDAHELHRRGYPLPLAMMETYTNSDGMLTVNGTMKAQGTEAGIMNPDGTTTDAGTEHYLDILTRGNKHREEDRI